MKVNRQTAVSAIICIILTISAGTVSAADYIENCGTHPDVLYGTKETAFLWAEVKPPEGIEIIRVWAEITDPWEDTVQADLVKLGNEGVFEYEYRAFSELGSYGIIFYAEDSGGSISFCADPDSIPPGGPLEIRKQEPGADNFEEDDNFSQAKVIFTDGSPKEHNFHDSGDTDWHRFTALSDQSYTIEVFDDNADTVFEIYDSEENLQAPPDGGGSWTTPQNGAGDYFIKFFSESDLHDSQGTGYGYKIKIYIPSAGEVGWMTGRITNAYGKALEDADIKETIDKLTGSDEDGNYRISRPPGQHNILFTKEGYENIEIRETFENEKHTERDICMSFAGRKGDMNGDGGVDLKDAVLSLKLLTGSTDTCSDCLGLETVIYILRFVAESS